MDKVELKILKNKQVKTQKERVSCAGNPTGSCYNKGNLTAVASSWALFAIAHCLRNALPSR